VVTVRVEERLNLSALAGVKIPPAPVGKPETE
jgi:hypothetical protein